MITCASGSPSSKDVNRRRIAAPRVLAVAVEWNGKLVSAGGRLDGASSTTTIDWASG
jgi:hypothetical protein